MKRFYLWPVIGPLLLCFTVNGQDCTTTNFNAREIQGNDYRLSMRTNGYQNGEGQLASFLTYDDPDAGWVGTLFAQNIWLGGQTSTGDLQLSAGIYGAGLGQSDFFPGPLPESGTVTENGCQNYNKIWKVARYQVVAHLADFADNGQIDTPDPAVLGWPGAHNPNFSEYNGFELPDNDDNLAPFFDVNADGVYDPMQGDYPVEPHTLTIAEELSWGVYNSVAAPGLATPDTEALPVEIQQTAWAFYCGETTPLNKTAFLRYQVTYHGDEILYNLRLGVWNDGNVGCFKDDAIGSAPEQNTWFYYNVDNDDDNLCDEYIPSVGMNPPVQSVTFLNQPLIGFIYNVGGLGAAPPATIDPVTSADYYNYLNATFRDGSTMRPAGDGYDEDPGLPETQFAFSGDPNDPGGWSVFTTGLPGIDYRALGITETDIIQPGATLTLDIAYAYHREPGNDHLENVTEMYDKVAEIQEIYNEGFDQSNCTAMLCDNAAEDCVWPGDLNADGIANYVDLVAMGFGFETEGPLRDGPDNWSPRGALNWSTNQADGTNRKHQDGNGDGQIDYDDFLVTLNHYNQTHSAYSPPVATINDGPDLRFNIGSGTDTFYLRSPGAVIGGRIRLTTEVEALRAITFEISFDTAFYDLFNITDPANEVLEWNYVREVTPELFEMAVYNEVEGLPANTNQTLLSVFLRLKNQSIDDFPAYETTIGFKNVRGWLADGSEVNLGARTTTIRFTEAPSVLTDPAWAGEVSVFPNPVNDLLELRTGNVRPDRLELFDATGRRLLTSPASTTVNLSQLPSGTYYLRLVARGESITRKVVKL